MGGLGCEFKEGERRFDGLTRRCWGWIDDEGEMGM